MLTLQDCIGLCELTEAEVEALAEHEHLSEIVAVELGRYLLDSPRGEQTICNMIRDDIADAQSKGNLGHSAQLKQVLKAFLAKHPGALTPAPAGVRTDAGTAQ